MKSDLWAEYDKAQERLRAARERTALAQAEERAVEAEVASARNAIELAVAAPASTPNVKQAGTPKPRPATPLALPSMASLASASNEDGDGDENVSSVSIPRPAPDGIRQTLWEVIAAIPRDGVLRGSDLRALLGLSEGAVNTRLANAKQAKLIEAAGWGMYRLTEQGRTLQGQRLRIVNNEE
jgi:hypothetical protein